MMIVGRRKEISILNDALLDSDSRFIAIYGRRRIGKTFLVRETYGYRFTFQHAGLFQGSLSEQIYAFESSIKDAGGTPNYKAKNWLEAFEDLKDLIRESKEKRKLIFFDELSWMDTMGSDLMIALENFWNGWASARKDIVLIVCASATSWMLSKVIHNKGGLYNRLTDQIHLQPLTLSECEELVQSKKIILRRNDILQYYMIFGGIPFYWDFLQKGLSIQQNVDNILFAEDAPLKDEFDYLYASVFKNPTVHIKIIEALGKKKIGMTREEIISTTGIINSGDLTKKLSELESCGFIREYRAFGMKKKNTVYQLIDNFTLFYYRFLENNPNDPHFWENQLNMPTINTWLGLAFERVCMMHIDQIRRKLGISGVLTAVNSWSCSADPDKGLHGSQIDLLIVRKDQVINLCEMKYSTTEYMLTEKDERSIQIKISDFTRATKTNYAIHPTLVTCVGMVDNTHSGDIQSVVTLEDLFKDV